MPVVLHVYSIKQWGLQSWRPWLLSLATDLLSRQATAIVATKQFYAFQANPDSAKEQNRRTMWLLCYLLRAPVFEKSLKPTIETLEQVAVQQLTSANVHSSLTVALCPSLRTGPTVRQRRLVILKLFVLLHAVLFLYLWKQLVYLPQKSCSGRGRGCGCDCGSGWLDTGYWILDMDMDMDIYGYGYIVTYI